MKFTIIDPGVMLSITTRSFDTPAAAAMPSRMFDLKVLMSCDTSAKSAEILMRVFTTDTRAELVGEPGEATCGGGGLDELGQGAVSVHASCS